MRVAIDFDGTIFKWAKYPNIGEVVPYAKAIINRLHASGHMIMICTCRGATEVGKISEALNNEGIKFHTINEQDFIPRFDPMSL